MVASPAVSLPLFLKAKVYSMPEKPIAIASDHAGYELKSVLVEELGALGHQVLDLGTGGPDSVDYPDFAHKLALALA